MSRYAAEAFTAGCRYPAASQTLALTTDDELIQRITPAMVSWLHLSPAAWAADDPEHDELAATLRAVAMADLNTLYADGIDPWCDDYLAAYNDPATGTRTLVVLYDQDPDGEQDGWDHHGNANPVRRLRALRVASRPQMSDTSITVDFPAYVTTAGTGTFTYPNEIYNITTGSRVDQTELNRLNALAAAMRYSPPADTYDDDEPDGDDYDPFGP